MRKTTAGWVLLRGAAANRMLGGLCLALAMALLAAWALSGRLAASLWIDAVQSRNLPQLIHLGHWPRLKEAAADDLSAMVPPNARLPGGKALPVELRELVNLAIRATADDPPRQADLTLNLLRGRGFVTSEAIRRVPPEWLARRAAQHEARCGTDLCTVKTVFEGSGESVTTTLERRGWFTWRAVRVEPNAASVLWPVRVN